MATDRLTSELAFHDGQAGQRSATFDLRPHELQVADAGYLAHETWIGPAFARLGNVEGRRVLDYGCGHGMAAVVLARRGARVTALDLAPGYLDEARRRAEANRVTIDFVQANGESLPLADKSFDRVWGNAILHHLDIPAAARQLWRVLRPGGIAVFCEPWAGNPLLHWARLRLPYQGKARTPDEEPLSGRQLRQLAEVFPNLEWEGFQFLSMVRRVLRPCRLVAALDRCDALLLHRVPALQRWCRYVVLTLRR